MAGTLKSRGGSTWPVLLAILAGVLAPTACVLWFASAAMRNERLAVRQRLTDVYRRELEAAQGRLDAHWEGLSRLLDEAAALPPALAFEKIAGSGLADGVIVFDANGNLAYPMTADALRPAAFDLPPAWEEAARLEDESNLPGAARAYGAIAREANSPDLKAWAMLAEARCLSLAGDANAALSVLRPLCEDKELRASRAPDGRLIVPSAMLRMLELCPGDQEEERKAAALLMNCVYLSYVGPPMPSPQRIYLWREVLARFIPGAVERHDQLRTGRYDTLRKEVPNGGTLPISWEMPILGAEETSVAYLESDAPSLPGPGLRRSAGGGKVWTFASPKGRVAALVGDWRWNELVEKLGPRDTPGATTLFHLGPPLPEKEPFLRLPASRHMPDGWLSLYLQKPDPFEAAADRQNLIYTWTAVVSIAAVCALALGVAAYVGRQDRLPRLKNDLIATVSHELKTPLASIRVLVDTLLDGRATSPGQAQDYFRLIARENHRLSRLIDNFLTFSRMERNKRQFDFAPVGASEIVQSAVESMGERLAPPHCEFSLEVAPGLPPLRADRDAMVTVLVNLLDNAWKYSPEPRRIALRAFAAGGGVRFQVADGGIGIPRRVQKRIFERFYQVDQTLSRKAGGCGLGLAIVKFILVAHGGTIEVASEPGKGSTFTVTLPAVGDRAKTQAEPG